MESGLECEGDVEGTMNGMALREERDWPVALPVATVVHELPRHFSPPAALASRQPNNKLHLPFPFSPCVL